MSKLICPFRIDTVVGKNEWIRQEVFSHCDKEGCIFFKTTRFPRIDDDTKAMLVYRCEHPRMIEAGCTQLAAEEVETEVPK